jgi:aspartate/methionine/tyrosine aminotransferase
MKLPLFKLEDYLAKHEFSAKYSLCSSDIETCTLEHLLAMADEETRRYWNTLGLGYTEPKGWDILRNEVATDYPGLTAENTLMFAGAQEGIYCTMQALLNPSDHAVVVTPCYQSLLSIPGNVCAITELPLKEADGWTLDVEALRSAMRPNTRMIVLNFPHNPTGALPTLETWQTVVDIAREYDCYIFSDEVYRHLELNATEQLPAMATFYEKGISLSVMSKAYGLAGLRIGWIACQDRTILKKIEEAKHYLSICNSGPSEVLALIALRNKATILDKNRALMKHNLSILEPFLSRYAHVFSWAKPKGGCIGFVRVNTTAFKKEAFSSPAQNESLTIEHIAEALLEEKGVLILPGSVYDVSKDYFRISYGRQNMPEALLHFEQFLQGKLSC